MPNWCYTNIKVHDSRQNIKRIDNEFQKAFGIDSNTSFGNRWLGNLLMHIGMSYEEVLNCDIRCRGSVIYYNFDFNNNEIRIDTETAWSPNTICIAKFLSSISDSFEMLFVAEEPGIGLYTSNDPDFVGKYNVDEYSLDECELCELKGFENLPEDPVSEDELKKALSTYFNDSSSNIDELIMKTYDDDKLKDLYIHKYEYDDIWEV